MRRVRCLFVGLLACALAQAAPITLFDPSLGTLPQDQPHLTYASLPVPSVLFHDGSAAVLDTSDWSLIHAGFSTHDLFGVAKNPALPAFDRTLGYRLGVAAALPIESHSSGVRAGFSLIALSSDSMGIEIGFWQNRVWVQDGPSFSVQGEGVSFDTTAMHAYDLWVADGGYALYADGAPLLAGALRDYSPFGLPYNLQSFLFLGDDTGSALARLRLGKVELEAGVRLPGAASTPEPGTLALLASGLAVAMRRRRRQAG